MDNNQPRYGFLPHTCVSSGGVRRPHAPLPLIESIFYLVAGLYSIAYMTYSVHKTSDKYYMFMGEEDFVDGWSFIRRKKDISNHEWNFWSTYFWKILPYVVGHIILGRIVEYKFLQYRKHVFLAYSILSIISLMGYQTILFFMIHSTICFVASSFRSFKLVWGVSLLLLSTLNYSPLVNVMKKLCGLDENHESFYLFVFVLAFAILRYTSFCLERCKYKTVNSVQEDKNENSTSKETKGDKSLAKKNKGNNSVGDKNKQENSATEGMKEDVSEENEDGFGLFDLYVYMFYLPSFFTGPHVTYDVFRVQINSKPAPWTKERVMSSIKGFIRVFFWATFLEISHHFLYHNAMPRNIGIIREMTLWSLAGLGYLEGQYFMVKYLVFYDLPGQVARLDDIHPPLGPKCISYIYRYSDMWKFFDRGLYMFLKKYIYIPLGGSQAGLPMQLFGSMLCFLYIFFWHGEGYILFVWCAVNYFGCSLELVGMMLERSWLITKMKSYLSPGMVRRIRCCLVTPLFLMSCFSIFYFFGGETVGKMFLDRLVLKASFNVRLVLFVVTYINLQNAFAFERWLALQHCPKKDQ